MAKTGRGTQVHKIVEAMQVRALAVSTAFLSDEIATGRAEVAGKYFTTKLSLGLRDGVFNLANLSRLTPGYLKTTVGVINGYAIVEPIKVVRYHGQIAFNIKLGCLDPDISKYSDVKIAVPDDDDGDDWNIDDDDLTDLDDLD